MSRLSRRVAGAVLLLALLGWYAWDKGSEDLQELLWGCHVTTSLVVVGLLLGSARLVAAATLYYACVGVPAWALEVLATGTTTGPSLALHVFTPLVGATASWGRPLPARTWALAFAIYPSTLAIARVATDPARNVNVAHAVWPAVAPWFPSLPIYWAFNGALALGALLLGSAAWARLSSSSAAAGSPPPAPRPRG